MPAAHVVSIDGNRSRRREAQGIARIEESCDGLAVVVGRHGKSPAYHALAVPAEQFRPDAITRLWRPGNAEPRQKHSLVPVVHRLAAVHGTGHVNDYVLVIGSATVHRIHPVLKNLPERNGGLHFESLGLIHRAPQAVAKTCGDSKVRAQLPYILNVTFVSLGCKVSRSWRPGRECGPVVRKQEVGCVLGEAS